MKALLLADHDVGFMTTQWLLSSYKNDIFAVVTTTENSISDLARQAGVQSLIFQSENELCALVNELGGNIDLGFLVWWPKIIKKPLISLPRYGFINTHPSLLPYNRGKHYNFWALVEEAPFGVSLHFVEEDIDSGDIIAQSEISYSWEDNGLTLYEKAKNEIFQLFIKSYPHIRTLNIPRRKQNLQAGSFHKSKEMDEYSRIELEKKYSAKSLLNLLRARTFIGQPSCYFVDNNEYYEVRVEIKKRL